MGEFIYNLHMDKIFHSIIQNLKARKDWSHYTLKSQSLFPSFSPSSTNGYINLSKLNERDRVTENI